MKKLFIVISIVLSLVLSSAPVFAAEPVIVEGTDPGIMAISTEIEKPAGQANEAYELYKKAVADLEGSTSSEWAVITRMQISVGEDTTIDTRSTSSMKQRTDDEGRIEMAVITTSDLGVVEQYYYRGWMFQNAGGEKVRARHNLDSDANSVESDLPQEFFNNATVEDIENGKRIRLRLTGEYVAELAGETLDAASMGADNLTIGSASLTIIVNDKGEFVEQRMQYNFTLTVEGIDMKARQLSSMKIVSLNSVDKIDFPRDLASYERVS